MKRTFGRLGALLAVRAYLQCTTRRHRASASRGCDAFAEAALSLLRCAGPAGVSFRLLNTDRRTRSHVIMSISSADTQSIVVLGAYGLAGRAIVERLVRRTHYAVVAAGRNRVKLREQLARLDSSRVRECVMDADDGAAVRAACTGSAFVINAVGPYAKNGASIARSVIEAGCGYLDCANEQSHYRRLRALDELARRLGVPMITAAGLIPGLSSLLIAHALQALPEADAVEVCFAQRRHAYAETGLGSIMGGILEAGGSPTAWSSGAPATVRMGTSTRIAAFPAPFGTLRLIEVPTIDDLVIPQRFRLREMHTWFYMGDLPTYLLGMIRVLQPGRRPWAYRLVETSIRRINDRETARAIAADVGPEVLLTVTAANSEFTRTHRLLFCDGAVPTACLPVHIVDRHLRGEPVGTGLLTPLDIVAPETVFDLTGDFRIDTP